MNDLKKESTKFLGLDIGSNSIGWAIYDAIKNDYTDYGVLIFDEGVSADDSLETPAGIRTAKRMGRRIKFRRRLRKFALLKILVREEMCPLTQQEYIDWKSKNIFPLHNKLFLDWQKSTTQANPYIARALAASEKVTKEELGRALYHIAQRRGFKSSRKDPTSDENSSVDDLGKIKGSIVELTQILKTKNCTLGQYFYEEIQAGRKVRKLHTGRKEHYIPEVEQICKTQELSESLAKEIHDALFLQRPLRSQAHLVGKCPISGQRRAQISHPDFETYRMWAFINTIRIVEDNKARELTPEEKERIVEVFYYKASYFKFERIIHKLYPKPSSKKIPYTHPEFNYKPDSTVKSCSVSHQLNDLLKMDYTQWSCEGTSKKGNATHYNYQSIIDALHFFDDNDLLKKFAKGKINLNDEQVEKLLNMRLPEGYAQYSLSTIRKILSFLKEGIELTTARFLANIPEAIGENTFDYHRKEITNSILQITNDYRTQKKEQYNKKIHIVPLSQRLKDYMVDRWNINNGKWSELFEKSSDNIYLKDHDKNTLPKVQLGMMRNPLVQRTLTTLRKFLNYMNKIGKIDDETQIHIELARNVNNRNMRLAYENWQKKQEKKRQDASEFIKENGKTPTDDMILRVLLANEQNNICMYTGKEINATHMLQDTLFDIDHTIPRSRGGNDSMANKTLCDLNYNRHIKKNKLPTECPNYENAFNEQNENYPAIAVVLKSWEEKLDALEKLFLKEKSKAKSFPADNKEGKARAQQKALETRFELDYWREKVNSFQINDDKLGEGFMKRQLVDTGIMTRHALEFLRSVYPRTYAVNGQVVAHARKAWGLQQQFKTKERVDHIHHAVDAMVIALLSRARFNDICTKLKSEKFDPFNSEEQTDKVWGEFSPIPYLYNKIYGCCENILVKYVNRHNELKPTLKKIHLKASILKDGKKTNRVLAKGDSVRGQLHQETFYGCIKPPQSKEPQYVIRKPLNGFGSRADMDKIVDNTVKNNILSQLDDYETQGISFKQAIQKEFWMKKPCPECPNGVPIKSVRIFARCTDPKKLKPQLFQSENEYKNHYYVNSAAGTNFKIAIFEHEKKGKKVISTQVINLLDFIQGKIDLHEIESQPGFKFFVSPRDCVLIFENDPEELKSLSQRQLSKRLYRNIKYGDTRGTFKFHRQARGITDLGKYLDSIGKGASGTSKLNFSSPEELLLITSPETFTQMLFEGIHFNISWNGTIEFLF